MANALSRWGTSSGSTTPPAASNTAPPAAAGRSTSPSCGSTASCRSTPERETGTLVTRPFRCEGGSLRINAAARGGELAVAVLDADGVQQEGFGRPDSALFDGDSVRWEMTWRRARFDDLRGRAIRLKFYLRNARLYSFQQGPSE